ncbi:MAG TPA: serine/threonine-protein kinase, partial [Phycisphaerae bacterium]|nr:serine/threonine-protein kinase [Phycisphaerae bacterium]
PHVVRVRGIDIVDEQPILAMEWVEGLSITRWASGRSQDECLRLFATVCEAVHHAHQRGVLHRDLKPSNILVDKSDCPRLLDFGVAAFISAPTQQRLTLSGHFAGTPDYAAPERLVIGGAADVRSDVYSLGVVLHEVLTGALPDRPSHAQFSDQGVRADLSALTPEVRSIIRKAINTEPDERYQSAHAFAQDLRRHLAGEPLEARPAGLPTLFRQFVRRHALATAFAVTVIVLLAGWGIVAGWLAMRLADRTAAAESAQRTTQRVNDFLMDVLIAPRPSRGGPNTTVLSLLEATARRADSDLADAPEVRAAVHACLGRTYETIFMNKEAASSLRIAVDLYRAQGPAGREKLLQALFDYAGALSELHDPAAIAAESEAVEIAAAQYGPADGYVASARASLAYIMWRCNGTSDEAFQLMRDSITRLDQVWPRTEPLVAVHRSIFADLLAARGEQKEAREQFELAIATLEAYADKNSDFAQGYASCMQNYASTLLALGLESQAEAALLKMRPVQIRLYGNRLDAYWYWRLAHVEPALGKSQDALNHAHAALAAAWKLPEPDRPAPIANWDDYFSKTPLTESPDVYARRVSDALLRKGNNPAEISTSMKWLSGLLAETGHPAHSAAVLARAETH